MPTYPSSVYSEADHVALASIVAADEKSQREKFIDKARELGCDEDEEAFAEKVRRIAKAPSPSKGSKKTPDK